MCRSLFCLFLEHTDRFPSSRNLLSCSVFGQTLVLPISPQFPESLAAGLPWLELVRASFVRRVFIAKATKSGSEGHWASGQLQQQQVPPWLSGLKGCSSAGLPALPGSVPGRKVDWCLPIGFSPLLCLAMVDDGRGLTYFWFKNPGILLPFKLIEKQARNQ